MVEIRMTHRWTHLLKQQSSITVSLLPTKENKVYFPFPFAEKRKVPFQFSVCSEQTEVTVFRFAGAPLKTLLNSYLSADDGTKSVIVLE
jgi:hypothetical protein